MKKFLPFLHSTPTRFLNLVGVTFLVVPLVFSVFLYSCYNSRDLSNRNLSDVYRKGEQLLHPEFVIFHSSDTTSTLYVKINPKELLFMRQPDDRFKASFNIHYSLLENYESTTVLGEGVDTYVIDQEDSKTPNVYSLKVKLPYVQREALKTPQVAGGWQGIMAINIADNQKNYNEDFFVNVDNTGKQNRQSFFVERKDNVAANHRSDVLMFKNYLSEKDSVRISYRDSTVKSLFVSCYFRNFPLAAPPHSFDIHDDFNYAPDSTFIYQVASDNYISFKRNGFYHFQVDTTEKDGVTLFRFANTFPNVTSPEQMIESVRYLTTKKEFEEMKQSGNKKSAMDKFWYDIGGNTERTKLLIKKYYSRVQEANRFFSSHTEGWRTDRGMVYIIFGKPNNVYKSANAESWIYGTPNNALSLNFFFVRVNNPFTDNDYTLTREPIYEGNWYRAVDVWREGRAYNDN
jgi:GWxTD domain-containing protein